MLNGKVTRRRRNRDQILQLLEKFEVAGVSVKEFCKTHHINQGNFHKWKSRYKDGGAAKKVDASGFTCIDVTHRVAVHAELFAEVNGIRIYRPVNASFLKELLS